MAKLNHSNPITSPLTNNSGIMPPDSTNIADVSNTTLHLNSGSNYEMNITEAQIYDAETEETYKISPSDVLADASNAVFKGLGKLTFEVSEIKLPQQQAVIRKLEYPTQALSPLEKIKARVDAKRERRISKSQSGDDPVERLSKLFEDLPYHNAIDF